MLLLLVVVLLIIFVLAPASHYGGYYPSTWHAGYGWLPALLVVLLLVWLATGGNLLR